MTAIQDSLDLVCKFGLPKASQACTMELNNILSTVEFNPLEEQELSLPLPYFNDSFLFKRPPPPSFAINEICMIGLNALIESCNHHWLKSQAR